MDTRFWGPPAWKLLHSIAATYEPAQQRKSVAEFLEILPYILPCKYCRSSLTAHYKALPYDGELDTREHLERWLYHLHGLVNNTLRKQGQTISADPSFRDVQGRGTELAAGSFPAWDFLFSVAYIYPPQTREVALPDAPKQCPVGATDCERNGWNKLAPGRRMSYWMRFWKVLPGVLPATWADSWVRAWKAAAPQDSTTEDGISVAPVPATSSPVLPEALSTTLMDCGVFHGPLVTSGFAVGAGGIGTLKVMVPSAF